MASGIEQEIVAHEDRRFAAMVAGDGEALGRLLHDGLVYTHSSASVDTKASFIDAVVTKRSGYQKIERPEQKVTVYGDSAVVAGQARIELQNASGHRVLNLRFTDVWVKGPSGWQMVAWQSTPIPA
jgi:ketosteroid isomerase-like protein